MRFSFYSQEQDIEEAAFKAAMYWRILYGSVRVFIGYKLLSLVGLPAVDAYQHLFSYELARDPHDALLRLAGHLLASHGFSVTYFLAAYLLFWGVMDVLLSISMLRVHLWAFDASLVIMVLFIMYELFRLSHTHSHALFGFILVDLFIVFLIYHERGRIIARHALKKMRNA